MMILAVFLFTLVVIAKTDGFLTTKGFYPWTSGYPVYPTIKHNYNTKYANSATTNKYQKYTTRNPFIIKREVKRFSDLSAQPWADDSSFFFPTKPTIYNYHPWMGGSGGDTRYTTEASPATTYYRPWMGGGSYTRRPTDMHKTTTMYRPWMGGSGGHLTTSYNYRPWMGGGGDYPGYPTPTHVPLTTTKYRPWMGGLKHF